MMIYGKPHVRMDIRLRVADLKVDRMMQGIQPIDSWRRCCVSRAEQPRMLREDPFNGNQYT